MSLLLPCPVWQNCDDAGRLVLFQGFIFSNFSLALGGDVGETGSVFQPGAVQALLAFCFRTVTSDAVSASQSVVSRFASSFSLVSLGSAAPLEQDWWAFLILSALCSGASWHSPAQVTPRVPSLHPESLWPALPLALLPVPLETDFWAVTA